MQNMLSYKVMGVSCLDVGYCNKVNIEIVLVLFMDIHTTINYLKMISIDWCQYVLTDSSQSHKSVESHENGSQCVVHLNVLNWSKWHQKLSQVFTMTWLKLGQERFCRMFALHRSASIFSIQCCRLFFCHINHSFWYSHHKSCAQFVTVALNKRDFDLINTKSCFQTLQRLPDRCSSRLTFICENIWQEVFDAHIKADTQTDSWSECMTFFLQSSYNMKYIINSI